MSTPNDKAMSDSPHWPTILSLGARVELNSVDLVESRFLLRSALDSTTPHPPDEIPKPDTLRTSVQQAREGSLLLLLTTFQVGYKEIDDEADFPIVAFARFRAAYAVPTDEAMSDEVMGQFTRGIALPHLYPYWREWLSGVTARSGIPPVTAPVLRVTMPPPGVAVAEPAPES